MSDFISADGGTATRLAGRVRIVDDWVVALTGSYEILTPTGTRNHEGKIFAFGQWVDGRELQRGFFLTCAIEL